MENNPERVSTPRLPSSVPSAPSSRWIFAGGSATWAAMALLKVGDAAPEFTATAHDGRTVRLADYKGKNVVLWFYPKADTPG